MGKVDLHIHSHYSMDGEFSVLDLIKIAEDAGITLASIVDHDNIQAARQVETYRAYSNIKWIPAIECTCMYNDMELHVLGYGIDPHFSWFDDLLERVKKAHRDVLKQRLDALNKMFELNLSVADFEIYFDEFRMSPKFIAKYILSNPNAINNKLLKPYISGNYQSPNHTIFVQHTMVYGKDAYVKCDLPSLNTTIEQIHLAGGLAVLSHPGNSVKEDNSLLNELIHLGIDGIEAYSSYHSEFQNVFYVEYALKRKLLITCGSDFYGNSKPYIRIGNTHCPLSEEEIIEGFKRKGLVL